MNDNIREFPTKEWNALPKEINLDKTLQIESLRGLATGMSKATDAAIQIVGGTIEEDDEHFTITLVVPKIFKFGTDVAKMMADMWHTSDEGIMVATSAASRVTFVVKYIYRN